MDCIDLEETSNHIDTCFDFDNRLHCCVSDFDQIDWLNRFLYMQLGVRVSGCIDLSVFILCFDSRVCDFDCGRRLFRIGRDWESEKDHPREKDSRVFDRVDSNIVEHSNLCYVSRYNHR